MPTGPRRGAGSTWAETEPTLDGRRILVCSATSPPVASENCVDVRPGFAATYDGDRVRLPLVVSGTGQRERIPWIDLPGLDAAVSSRLDAADLTVVRFGNRSACRRALGRTCADTVERRLSVTAREAGSTLVIWTDLPSDDVDGRPYDLVVDGATGTD